MSELLSVNELDNKTQASIKDFLIKNDMEDIPKVDNELEVIYYSNAGDLLNEFFTNISIDCEPIDELTEELIRVNYDIAELIKTCFNDYMFKTVDDKFIEIVVTDS